MANPVVQLTLTSGESELEETERLEGTACSRSCCYKEWSTNYLSHQLKVEWGYDRTSLALA